MAADKGVGPNAGHNKRTGKYMRQGHTSGAYGNDPGVASKNRNPSELTP